MSGGSKKEGDTMTRVVLTLTLLGLVAQGARAQTTTAECRLQAKGDYVACKADCKEAFQAAKDACRNCDHSFAEGCRTSRALCEAPFDDILDACIDLCKTTLQGDKVDCQTAHDDCVTNGGTTCDADLDTCVDAAQVKAFVCRDTCRENQTVRDGINACRETFRGCMRSCPPAS
jgi:hypothetical protein